jgi:glycosyltransferase involved in cell wall biosynthesis
MRVLIVAPNISIRMGGEAILPYHYIRELKALGVDVHALTHARVRDEILNSDISDCATFHFVEDAAIERLLYRSGKLMPPALRDTAINSAIGAVTLARLGRRARKLEREIKFDVIHQPTPVSPLFPSFLNNMQAPLIVGPMNGAMSYPPAFEKHYAEGSVGAVAVARAVSGIANRLAPGKRQAARLLVANDRTQRGLPNGIDPSKVSCLIENGVDLQLWSPERQAKPASPVFVFVGRLVHWKALDLLLEAFAEIEPPARLVIIGDGPDRTKLEQQAQILAGDRIEFLGFRSQSDIRDILAASTALVLPSMRECGGAVVLEAFACATPAIATDWGGPQDYITPQTGYLIAPDARASFISGLRDAMAELARDPARTQAMGAAARAHIEREFSWQAKTTQMLEIYRAAMSGPS